ncbi:unnamed protein product [Porites lobata]|uniref:Ribosomal protein S18 n=1 Tax=Porites lobata TaxID=104759 RepID=A0ABN8NMY5_9CNID|nr:unnamed protein product [Porites lobata]
MAAISLSRLKLLNDMALFPLTVSGFSRYLHSSSIICSSSTVFSMNNLRIGRETALGVRRFSLQSWLGIKASILTEEKINKADVGCPICSRDITFTYKDVLFLSQFMSPRGYILNRRETGVCRKQQRKLEKAIKISQRLGLLPKLAPALQKELAERKLAEKKMKVEKQKA